MCVCVCVCVLCVCFFPFWFLGRMWDLNALVPDHCPSFYLSYKDILTMSRIKFRAIEFLQNKYEFDCQNVIIYENLKIQVHVSHMVDG